MARTPGPWYRKSRGEWRVELGGVQHLLCKGGPEDRDRAQEEFHKLMVELNERKKAAEKAAATPPVIGAVVVRYLAILERRESEGELTESHLSSTTYVLKRWVKEFGKRQFTAVTTEDIVAWLERGGKQGPWGPSTRRLAVGVVRNLWKFANSLKVQTGNPFEGLKLAPGKRREAIPTREQFEELLAALEFPEAREVLRFVADVGCRPNEAFRLSGEMIDWERNVAVMGGKTTKKTGKLRVLYLPAGWMTRLKDLAQRHPEGPIFRAPHGGPWNRDLISYHIRKVAKGKNWPWATTYALRHLFVTEALRRDVSIAKVAALVGHASTDMISKHYSHLSRHDEDLHQALEQVLATREERRAIREARKKG